MKVVIYRCRYMIDGESVYCNVYTLKITNGAASAHVGGSGGLDKLGDTMDVSR